MLIMGVISHSGITWAAVRAVIRPLKELSLIFRLSCRRSFECNRPLNSLPARVLWACAFHLLWTGSSTLPCAGKLGFTQIFSVAEKGNGMLVQNFQVALFMVKVEIETPKNNRASLRSSLSALHAIFFLSYCSDLLKRLIYFITFFSSPLWDSSSYFLSNCTVIRKGKS